VVTPPGYCDVHRAQQHRDYGRARRGFDTELGFYQSAAWRGVRAAFLRANPLCLLCNARGRLVAAKVVDHITPLKAGGERVDASNLQGLCVSCHNAKTARETAGHGR
jgi:5-methylcytosine-specific restriction protein A